MLQIAELVDYGGNSQVYNVEYTIRKMPGPQRHLYSSVVLGSNGRWVGAQVGAGVGGAIEAAVTARLPCLHVVHMAWQVCCQQLYRGLFSCTQATAVVAAGTTGCTQ